MYLNTKIVLTILLFVSFISNAQIFGRKNGGFNSYKLCYLTTGIIVPSGIGDNFVSEGAKVKPGLNIGFQLNVYRGIFAGVRFDAFGFDIENNQLSGSYIRSNTYGFAGILGYRFFENNRIATTVFGGVGGVSYANKRSGDIHFTEDGTSYFLTADVELKLTKYFQLYAAPEFRFDRLNIIAPPQVEDRLNNINYFTLNVGIRVSFWNIEEEENLEKEL